jgi:dTDP-3-amino-3,4,6-trideoxy-alpha-D-glucose transaminase
VSRAPIPLFATRPALEPLLPEIAERQRRVLDSGTYILGPEVEAFEAEFAAYVGRRHCVGVGSGTDALTIAMRALGIGAGDEVVVPAFTFFATAEAVIHAGATPVFCDVDPRTHCMTAAMAERAITDRTRALVPVHLFGNPAPMHELLELARSRGLAVIEDAAQAAGTRLDGAMAGSYGDAAAFSFYPGKNLGAMGDGGAVVFDDDDAASLARRLRDHGSSRKWMHTEVGYTSRLDALQAVALRVLLPHLDDWNQARRSAVELYLELGLADLVTTPTETARAEPSYHLFVVSVPGRDEVQRALADAGVEARPYYTPALHRQPAMAPYVDGRVACPNAERIAADNLALPMGPSLDEEALARVAGALREATTGGG